MTDESTLFEKWTPVPNTGLLLTGDTIRTLSREGVMIYGVAEYVTSQALHLRVSKYNGTRYDPGELVTFNRYDLRRRKIEVLK